MSVGTDTLGDWTLVFTRYPGIAVMASEVYGTGWLAGHGRTDLSMVEPATRHAVYITKLQ